MAARTSAAFAGLRVFAVSDVQRIEGHGGLFGGALVGESDDFRVVGDALQHAQGDGSIVLHGGKAFSNVLRQGRSRAGGVDDDVAIRIELAHFRGNGEQLVVEILRGCGIDLLGDRAGIPRSAKRSTPDRRAAGLR